jgi:hypothetical protein
MQTKDQLRVGTYAPPPELLVMHSDDLAALRDAAMKLPHPPNGPDGIS